MPANKRFPWPGLALIALAVLSRGMVEADSESAGNGVTAEDRVYGWAFGEPLPGLSPPARRSFDQGFDLFVKVWSPEEGLGPGFNARSCLTCHAVPMPGGSGTTERTFVPHLAGAGREEAVAHRFHLDRHGATLEASLPNKVGLRRTPPLFGLGLLDAVPDVVLLEHGDPDDLDGDGISGRLPRVDGGYGRFGAESRVASLEGFVRLALITEMGLASRGPAAGGAAPEPVEVAEEQVRQLTAYLSLLAAPPRTRIGPLVPRGEEVFERIGCASCHRPTLRTGDASPFASLRKRTFHPYSDLLLHDMGGVSRGGAGRELRTTPLWGLSSTGPPYLHDGRAASLEEAILAHGGEGRRAAEAFEQLGPADREALIELLRSL